MTRPEAIYYGWILRMGPLDEDERTADYGFLLTLPGRSLYCSRRDLEWDGPFIAGTFVSYQLLDGQAVHVNRIDKPTVAELLAAIERWAEIRSLRQQRDADWPQWQPIFSRVLLNVRANPSDWTAAALRVLPVALPWAYRLWVAVHDYAVELAPLATSVATLEADWELAAFLITHSAEGRVPAHFVQWLNSSAHMPKSFIEQHLPWIMENAIELGQPDSSVRFLTIEYLEGRLGSHQWSPLSSAGAVIAFLREQQPERFTTALEAAAGVHPALVRLLFYALLANYDTRRTELRQLWDRVPSLEQWPESHMLYTLLSWAVKRTANEETLLAQLSDQIYQHFAHTGNLLQPVMHELFPVCDQRYNGQFINPGCYCEASRGQKARRANTDYWCRQKPCPNPHIFAELSKPWYRYNTFDWLEHLRIPYRDRIDRDRNPDEFPSKLAGWYNRLNQVRPHLRCRHCGDVLVPDLRYSRASLHTRSSDSSAVSRPGGDIKGAAYQDTVFFCQRDSCQERVYLSHCLGCRRVIDSRDQTEQCSLGRYICDHCGACCPHHNRRNPV